MISVKKLRELRVSLVDQLEDHIDLLVEQLLLTGHFSRDDREEVLVCTGPRARVRKVLDILECKGEEAADEFLSLCSQRGETRLQSADYRKTIDKHKAILRRRSECMLLYNTRHGEKKLFSQHYVNLLLVKGHHSLELKQHEILAFGQHRISLQRHGVEQRVISAAQLFTHSHSGQMVRKVLVSGVAGIGKTVLVQKILNDFGNNREHQAFDFVILLTFRDLNLIKQPISMKDLLQRKNTHLVGQVEKILANDERLLIVLDGFDEFRFCQECDMDDFVTEVEQEADLVQILASLLHGELLPRTSLLLTSRPTAIGFIPIACIDSFVLITGFSMIEIEDFFQRYFQDALVVANMLEMVKANELMLTLCYIPAFCYIICSILQNSDGLCLRPRTMSDIYTQYLLALLRSHTYTPSQHHNVLLLGKLAYRNLLEHQTLFYSHQPEIRMLIGCELLGTFMDKTSVAEAGYTEDIYSFTHLTVQEFLAALYYSLEDEPWPDALHAGESRDVPTGHLDLFHRFLSGLLSERNQQVLGRCLQVGCSVKVQSYVERLLDDLQRVCESGEHMLNLLHCVFEQQDASLCRRLRPKSLRVNVGNSVLSRMDYTVIFYFLQLMEGNISELDLTACELNAERLRDLRPHLLRCDKLWIGENGLDLESVEILADVLQSTNSLTHLGIGWTDIGDEEWFVLLESIQKNHTLNEIWMEGNYISYSGLCALRKAARPPSLHRVIAIWNAVSEDECAALSGDGCGVTIVAAFTDDSMWEEWGRWVVHRCEGSSDDQLLTFLPKVCHIPAQCGSLPWVQSFCGKLQECIGSRTARCTEEHTRAKLQAFHLSLTLSATGCS